MIGMINEVQRSTPNTKEINTELARKLLEEITRSSRMKWTVRGKGRNRREKHKMVLERRSQTQLEMQPRKIDFDDVCQQVL